MSIQVNKRIEELKAQGYDRNHLIELLVVEFPKYHEDYLNERLSDFENRTVESEESKNESDNFQKVKVVGFDMSFVDMVFFMVKWAIAAIPAIILLGIIYGVIATILGIFGLVLFQ